MLKSLNYLKRPAVAIIDLILPPKCICGKNFTADTSGLCADCWSKIGFINGSCCNKCGDPFEIPGIDDMLCISCLNKSPKFEKQRCLFKYDEHSSFIISKFKYSDATYIQKFLAPKMASICNEFIDEVDVITSVPMHYKKLLRRKYNQSAILANGIGKATNKKVNNLLLKRIKNNIPQAELERKDRLKNVKNSFQINNQYVDHLKGKTVLLVDDVITTGATINECIKTLLGIGVKKVFVVAAARTLK